jgi:hypothetical protein
LNGDLPPRRIKSESFLARSFWDLADLEQILSAEEWKRLVEDVLGADAFDAGADS